MSVLPNTQPEAPNAHLSVGKLTLHLTLHHEKSNERRTPVLRLESLALI